MSILPELESHCLQVSSLVLFFLPGSTTTAERRKWDHLQHAVHNKVLFTFSLLLFFCILVIPCSLPIYFSSVSILCFGCIVSLKAQRKRTQQAKPDWQVQYFHLSIFDTMTAAEPHCRVQFMDHLSYPAAWKPAFFWRRLITVKHSPKVVLYYDHSLCYFSLSCTSRSGHVCFSHTIMSICITCNTCYLCWYQLGKMRYLYLFILYFILEQVVSLISWHHQQVWGPFFHALTFMAAIDVWLISG